jgi:hephaestin
VIRRPAAAITAVAAAITLVVAGCTSSHTSASITRATSTAAMAESMAGSTYWSRVRGGPTPAHGRVRTYFLGADPVVWDYAPQGRNDITGRPFDTVADTFVKSGTGRIGSRYLKCLYRGYTDATFAHLTPQPASQHSLGLLGPVIRAQVGDTIKVVFRNACSFPTSVHVHGLSYAKTSEGTPYNDDTTGADKADDTVPTGGRYTYTWQVPERAGPGPRDGSSVMWMYHSHADEVADTNAGLMGPIVVTARGMARADGSPKDVDQEAFALFSVMDENKSPLLAVNLRRFARQPYPAPQDDDFNESNLMHSINGYVFGNQPMITLKRGEHVRWYVMSMGTEVDLHTPHWHGNTITANGMRMDVVSLLPASMVVADMVPDNLGIWLFHCHVNDHITAGMLTRYQVVD